MVGIGSVVKGIGKIAIFQDGAKAIAKNAEPLLDGIRKINPEWGDIGKLRTAINSNWDKGVASGQEIWFEVLGKINTGIAGIPTPPKWIWGGTRLTIYKKQIQDIIGQINKLSNTKLDEALGVIRREVDAVLDECDRIIRGGEPQLATEGVGNVNPSRIDANQPMWNNQPLKSTGTPDGSLPKTTTYSPDAVTKFRQIARRIRELAKKHSFDIPKKMKKPETQQAIKDYVDFIVKNGETKVGAYKPTGGGDLEALWTQYGDTIVLRRANGEFITFLNASGGGQALNSPF